MFMYTSIEARMHVWIDRVDAYTVNRLHVHVHVHVHACIYTNVYVGGPDRAYVDLRHARAWYMHIYIHIVYLAKEGQASSLALNCSASSLVKMKSTHAFSFSFPSSTTFPPSFPFPFPPVFPFFDPCTLGPFSPRTLPGPSAPAPATLALVCRRGTSVFFFFGLLCRGRPFSSSSSPFWMRVSSLRCLIARVLTTFSPSGPFCLARPQGKIPAR